MVFNALTDRRLNYDAKKIVDAKMITSFTVFSEKPSIQSKHQFSLHPTYTEEVAALYRLIEHYAW